MRDIFTVVKTLRLAVVGITAMEMIMFSQAFALIAATYISPSIQRVTTNLLFLPLGFTDSK